jgi:hypothetical protein
MDMLTVKTMTAEGGNQRRMNVDSAERKIIWDENMLQKSSHDYQLSAPTTDLVENNFRINLVRAILLSWKNGNINTRVTRDLNSSYLAAIADDTAQFDIEFPTLPNLDQISQGCSTARNHHDDRQVAHLKIFL